MTEAAPSEAAPDPSEAADDADPVVLPMYIGAVVTLVMSVGAIVISVILTQLKFKDEFTPWNSSFSSCTFGETFSCQDALQSAWSAPLGVPLSVLAVGFYSVVIALSLGVLIGRLRIRDYARPLLVVLGLVDLLVTVVMASVAVSQLDRLCLFCIFLYVVSLFVMFSSMFVNLPLDERAKSNFRLLFSCTRKLVDVLFLSALIFVFTVGVQTTVYQFSRRFIEIPPPPPTRTVEFPETLIEAGPEDRHITIYAVLDPACSHCAKEFPVLLRLVENQPSGIKFGVRVLLLPRDRNSKCVPDGFGDLGKSQSQSCEAGIAAECVELQHPGFGAKMLAELYRRQSGTFTFEKIAAAAKSIGLEATVDDDDPLFQCINENDEIVERILGYIDFVRAEMSNPEVPILYFVPRVDGVDRLDLVKRHGKLPYGYIVQFALRYIEEASASPQHGDS